MHIIQVNIIIMVKALTISKLKKKLEKLVADYVKLRDNYTCQWCGKKVAGSNCHASHVINKAQGNQFRFDPLNLKVLCMYCHMHKWHKDPVVASEWFKSKFPDRYDYLYNSVRKTVKFSRFDYESMVEDMKEKIKEFTTN